MSGLGQFLLIRSHEKKDIIYFLILFFLIGVGMALGRGTAEALFFKRYGIEYLPMMYVALGGLLVVVTSVYASFADRLPAENLLKKICFILSGVLIMCWIVMTYLQWDGVYPVYFLIYEIASEILLVHSALYVSQNFDTLQSKRLIPIILAGAQIGTIVGGLALAGFSLVFDIESLLLVWIFTLTLSLLMIRYHHKNAGSSPYFRNTQKRQSPINQIKAQFAQCFKFARHSRLMKAMSWCLFFTVIVFYILAFSVNQIYTDYFDTEESLSSFFGLLVAANGFIALLIQLFLTNKIIERMGLRASNLIFPTVTLFSFAFLFSAIALPAALVGSFVKDALMPAIRNPIRNMFFNAIPENLRGRAHAFSIGLVLPVAMMATGGLLIMLQGSGSLNEIVLFGLFMSLPLLWFTMKMNQDYGPAILNELRKNVYMPDESLKLVIQGEKNHIMSVLKESANSDVMEVRYSAAETFLDLYADTEIEQVLEIVKTLSTEKQDILLQQIMPLVSEEKRAEIFDYYSNVKNDLYSTLLFSLINEKDEIASKYASLALRESHPKIIAAGVFGVLSLSVEDFEKEAWDKWDLLMGSDAIDEILAGLDIFMRYPSSRLLDGIFDHLHSNNIGVQQAAINTLPNWPAEKGDDLYDTIEKLSSHVSPVIRINVLQIVKLLSKDKQNRIASICLQDNNVLVREEAARILFSHEEDQRIIANWICYSNFSPDAKKTVMNLLFSQEPQLSLLKKIVQTNLTDAEDFFKVYEDISRSLIIEQSNKSNFRVLMILLLERCQQTLDNVLNTIKQYEEKESIGIISLGIKSKEPAHVANACEALSTLQDPIISKKIIVLIEKLNEALHKPGSKNDNPLNDIVLDKALHWCLKRNDNWLSMCADDVSSFVRGKAC